MSDEETKNMSFDYEGKYIGCHDTLFICAENVRKSCESNNVNRLLKKNPHEKERVRMFIYTKHCYSSILIPLVHSHHLQKTCEKKSKRTSSGTGCFTLLLGLGLVSGE